MSRDALTAPYFAEADSWESDRLRVAQRALRLLSWSAALGWLCAVAAVAALVLLMPLKDVRPYVVRVDTSTGVIDVVPTYRGGAPLSQSVTRYLLTHYVQVCERFNFSTAESDYEECAALHTPQRNQAWAQRWARSNPASPLNLYRDGTVLRAQVQSVSFFSRSNGVADLAQVRYLVARRTAAGAPEQVTHWIATIQYAYVDPPQDPKVRSWNPLGFRIVEFHPEPEVEESVPDVKRAAVLTTAQGAAP